MSKKVLVSLVSKQTIPNVELIKEYREQEVRFLFISTEKMKDRMSWILDACKIDQFDLLIVNPYNQDDILEKLDSYNFENNDIILNVTCGTKIMSLVIYEYFKNIGGVTIYYLTGHNKQYLKLFPNRGDSSFTLSKNLTLDEYLTAYGFEYNDTKPFKDLNMASRVFDFSKSLSNDEYKQIFEQIRLYRDKNMLIENKQVLEFVKHIQYENIEKLNKQDTKYLSGEWFEEYVYYKIKEELGLDCSEIATGVNIKKEGDKNGKKDVENELDVIFVFENKLYIIECKTSIIDNRMISRLRNGHQVEELKEINLLSEIIYKSDSLRNNFGLFANTSIITMEEIKDENGNYKQRYKSNSERAAMSNIKIISRKDLINCESFCELLGIN